MMGMCKQNKVGCRPTGLFTAQPQVFYNKLDYSKLTSKFHWQFQANIQICMVRLKKSIVSGRINIFDK